MLRLQLCGQRSKFGNSEAEEVRWLVPVGFARCTLGQGLRRILEALEVISRSRFE